MHGQGVRKVCGQCFQSIKHLDRTTRLGWAELQGPRNITASNIDRILDNHGMRFLVLDDKNPGELMLPGQRSLYASLSRLPMFDVWEVRGTQQDLTVHNIKGGNSEFKATGNWDTLQALTLQWFDTPPRCLCGAKENMPRCDRCASWWGQHD